MTEDVLGDDGTISRADQVRYTAAENESRPTAGEMTGRAAHIPQAHMQNFFDCIRGGGTELSVRSRLRVSIACRMAVDSYRQGRTLRWDAAREEIV